MSFDRCGQNPDSSHKIASILLGAGATPNNGGTAEETPLHEAMRDCLPETVEMLLKYGARSDIQDKKGTLPFDIVPTDRDCRLQMMEKVVQDYKESHDHPITVLVHKTDEGTGVASEQEFVEDVASTDDGNNVAGVCLSEESSN